jgi:hypothetical protein
VAARGSLVFRCAALLFFASSAIVGVGCGSDGASGGSDDGGVDGTVGADAVSPDDTGADEGTDTARGTDADAMSEAATDAWPDFDVAACNCIDAAPKCCSPTLCVSDHAPAYGCAQIGCNPCPTYPNATATCMSGACAPSCAAGWGDCDKNAANGCETATINDVANCGGCGQACAPLPNASVKCTGTTCGLASCNTGWGNCDGNDTNGCETDLTTSQAHCGACTIACGSGLVCFNGNCGGVNQSTVATLATGLDFGATSLGNVVDPCQIAVDDVAAYLATRTAIYKIAKTGGALVQLAGGGTYGIAVDATYVYFGDSVALNRVPKAGGAVTPVVTSAQPSCITLDATSLYYTQGPSVWSAAKAASGGATRLATVTGGSSSRGLAVDGTNVYWGTDNSVGDGTLYSAPMTGGAATPLSAAFGILPGVAVDATNVYYTSFSPGAVAYTKVGGAKTTIVPGALYGVAVDAVDVFVAGSNGTINRTPVAGGATVVLADGFNNPNSLAIDTTRVYFTELGNGATCTLKSVAK